MLSDMDTDIHTDMVGTPFFREASSVLETDSASSFPLSFTVEESRSIPDSVDCKRVKQTAEK